MLHPVVIVRGMKIVCVCVCARKEKKGHKMIFSREGKAESEGTSGVSGEGEGGG